VASAKGANISLDQQFVADFKELLPHIKNFALNKGIMPPVVEPVKAKSA
jgi:hypothetical protein